jgi:gamma-glutamyl phosphate reductase
MNRASDTLIPVTLELGGKDAFIVCEDVDLPSVVQVAVRAALQSSGQNCAGAERFYVHKDIYSTFVSQVVKIIKSISVVSTQNCTLKSVLTCNLYCLSFDFDQDYRPVANHIHVCSNYSWILLLCFILQVQNCRLTANLAV